MAIIEMRFGVVEKSRISVVFSTVIKYMIEQWWYAFACSNNGRTHIKISLAYRCLPILYHHILISNELRLYIRTIAYVCMGSNKLSSHRVRLYACIQ